MANMHVGVTLSLADTASGPLRAFVGIVEQLQTVTNRLAPRLEAVAAGLANITRAVGSASGVQALAGHLGALNAALGNTQAAARGAATGIGNVSARASSGGTAVYALEQAVAAMTGALTRAAGVMTATAGGMQQMGAGAQAGAGHLNAAGAAAQTANTHVSTLRQTLTGMAQLWGAMKIKDGLVDAVKGASGYETSKARAQTMGLTESERARIETAALGARALVPQFDRRQTFEMAIDLKNAMNSLDAALAILPEMAQFAQNLKSQTKDGKINDDILVNVGKILQQRGAVQDPAKMRAEADMLLKIMTATQGRVNVETMFGNLVQMKGALSGDNVSRDFLPVLAGLAEMNRNGNGGTLGTQLTTMARYVMGNVANGMSAKEAHRLDLLEREPQWNSLGNIDLKASELRMKGSALFQQNPLEWVKQVLLPAIEKSGANMGDANEINAIINRIFKDRNAGEIAGTMATKWRQLDADSANVNRALGSKEQTEINSQTSQAKWDALTGKLRDLAIVVGEKLLPPLRVVADVMAKMLDGVGAFFTAFPTTATFLVWATALGSVALAVRGFMALFGILGTFAGMIGGVGTAATAAGAAASVGFFARLAGFGSAVAGLAGVVVAGFARMIPLVGLLILAWDFREIVGKVEVFGKSIKSWAGDVADFMLERFKAMFGFVGWIIDTVNGLANGGGKAPAGGGQFRGGKGASGSWDGGSSPLPAGVTPSAAGAGRGNYAGYPWPSKPAGASGGGGGRRVAVAPDGTIVLMPDNREGGRAAVRDGDPYYSGSADPVFDAGGPPMPDNREAGRAAVRAGDPHYFEQVATAVQKAVHAMSDFDKAMADVTQQMGEATRTGLGEMFSSILRGTQSADQAIGKFFKNLANHFLDMIGKKLGDALFESLFGDFFKSGGSGGSGLINSFLGLFGGFGGGGGGAVGSSMGGWVSGGGYSVGGAGAGMATGTNYVPRDMIALIHKGEAVVPAKFNPAAMGAGGAQVHEHRHSWDDSVGSRRMQDVMEEYFSRAAANR